MKNGEIYFKDSNGKTHYLGKLADFMFDEIESSEFIGYVIEETERYISLSKKDIELSFTINRFNTHILDRQQVVEEVYQKHKWSFL